MVASAAAMWPELHRRALTVNPGTDDSAWLAAFSGRVPCGECRRHWAEILKANPPIWTDYFAWTVARHNDVNRRLGKPVLDVATARALLGAASAVP